MPWMCAADKLIRGQDVLISFSVCLISVSQYSVLYPDNFKMGSGRTDASLFALSVLVRILLCTLLGVRTIYYLTLLYLTIVALV